MHDLTRKEHLWARARGVLDTSSMHVRLGRLSSVVTVAALALLAPTRAEAEPSAARAEDAELARLSDAKDGVASTTQLWAGQRYGHAEALVRAPFDVVRRGLLDHARLFELGGRFASARVLARSADKTDVYLRLGGGEGRSTWEVLRFGAPRSEEGYVVVEARPTAGNTRQGHLVVSARQVDGGRTIVKVDARFVPNFATAPAALDEEMRGFAKDLATGLAARARAEATPLTVAALDPVPAR